MFPRYSTIVLQPSVSVGNVPQLTVDLILNTLKLERVGWINDDSLLPVVGNDALDFTRPAGYLHTGAEGESKPVVFNQKGMYSNIHVHLIEYVNPYM